MRRLRNAPAFTITTVLTLALGIGATTSIFTLVHAVILKSLAVANPGELYRLGKEARCCYWGGYSQEKEFSLVSYDLYEYFRDNTKDFPELAAFQAITDLFGVRRAGHRRGGAKLSGGIRFGQLLHHVRHRTHAGRRCRTGRSARRVASRGDELSLVAAKVWIDPSVIGSVFNLDDKPVTVVGITPPGFFGDTLRSTPPDFFLPLNTERM